MQDNKTIRVIGHVDPTNAGFSIVLDQRYAKGLLGLGEFSHAIVLWWASEFE